MLHSMAISFNFQGLSAFSALSNSKFLPFTRFSTHFTLSRNSHKLIRFDNDNARLDLATTGKMFAAKENSVQVEKILDNVKWDEKGLVVAIAQNVDTGAILMQGFANREAVSTTIATRKATFYSRSRSSLWIKGETSMNYINVHDIFLDCDRDSLIYLGKPDGPTCHTGSETCYYSSIDDLLDGTQTNKERLASTTLYSLENTISKRNAEIKMEKNGKKSWTKKLLSDNELLSSKIQEEAGELIQTLTENEDKYRTASEMADLLYHAMVLLTLKDVRMEQVFEILRKRFSQSGIEEKSSRKLNRQN